MLYWALIFFVITVVAAIFAFGGSMLGIVALAQALCAIAVVLFLLFLISALTTPKELENK